MKQTLYLPILCLIISCTSNPNSWDKQNIRSLDVEDPAIKTAMDSAQKNIENFVRHYRENLNDTSMSYFVKHGFSHQEIKEHMWVRVVSIDSGIIGVLDNVPQEVKNVNYLDTVLINRESVEDFVIYHGDTLIHGDYLTEALQQDANN